MLLDLLKSGNINGVFEAFKTMPLGQKNEALIEEMDMLEIRWNILNSNFRKGIVSDDDYKAEVLKITLYIRQLLVQLEPSKQKAVLNIQWSVWFWVFLILICVLLIVFIPCPTSVQYGLFKVLIALSAAGSLSLIPDSMLTIQLPRYIQAGGAVLLFLILFYIDPVKKVAATKCENIGNLLVYLRPLNYEDYTTLHESGQVFMAIGDSEYKGTIGPQGEVLFTHVAIEPSSRASFRLIHPEPYDFENPDSIYAIGDHQTLSLPVHLIGSARLFGTISDEADHPLDSVMVQIMGELAYTNKSGFFSLTIPREKQQKFQTVECYKPGYEKRLFSNIPVFTPNAFNIILKKQKNGN